MSITEIIQTHLNKNELTDGIFIDLRKAFDTVDHDILITKLDHYGIKGLPNDWFRSYLKGRQQYIGNQASTIKEIVSGVPQGNVLGPLLFLIYINDLHSCLKYSSAYHFADDTNITLLDSLQETLAKRMNYDLRKLSMWLRANKLSLNVEKTELVVFWRQNTKLNNSFKIKLDRKRSFPTTSVKISWCSFRWTLNLVSSNLTCPGEIQLSNWNTQQAKVPSKHSYIYSKWYTILSLKLIFFMPASYGVKTMKPKINFELSKIEHSKNRI